MLYAISGPRRTVQPRVSSQPSAASSASDSVKFAGIPLCALGQGHALGQDRLPPTIVDGAPIDDINPIGQVALAKRLGQPGGLVERQAPACIDRQIEIRITSGPPGRP